MDAEQLRQVLIERGFYEAAAMPAADVEAQALEEDEERDDEGDPRGLRQVQRLPGGGVNAPSAAA